MFSGHYNLNNDRFISVGAQFGLQSTQLNLSNAILEDPTEFAKISERSGTALNAGLGAYYYSPDIIAGVSIMDIGANNQSFFNSTSGKPSSYPFTLFGTFGYIRKLTATLELIPAATFRYSTGYNAAILDLTAKTLINEKFMAGAGYRSTRAPLIFLGYLLDGRYSFNYCYGLQPNTAFESARSSHELMFSMNIQNKAARLIPTNYRWR
jgi:type IX secretion system PorP/SprF family membrane protein